MAASLFQNCFLCDNAMDGVWARPDCCDSHWFHLKCLRKLPEKGRRCPFDTKQFKSVVCKDGRTVTLEANCSDQDSDKDSDDDEMKKMKSHLQTLAFLSALASVEDLDSESRKSAPKKRATSKFKCDICNEFRDEMTAKTNTCGHEFHESCIKKVTQKENLCPKPGCKAEYTSLITQNGIEIGFQTNPLHQMLSTVAVAGSFRCKLCKKDDPSRERAKAKPCQHEFHRGCLIEWVRKKNSCPICRARILSVNCMFGPDLPSSEIQDSSSQSDCAIL